MYQCKMVSFNTQPPEGGWVYASTCRSVKTSFNTQPPEGGWRVRTFQFVQPVFVSTHSRPKAAGFAFGLFGERRDVSTHSRPKAAGPFVKLASDGLNGFNTQPPEGGW